MIEPKAPEDIEEEVPKLSTRSEESLRQGDAGPAYGQRLSELKASIRFRNELVGINKRNVETIIRYAGIIKNLREPKDVEAGEWGKLCRKCGKNIHHLQEGKQPEDIEVELPPYDIQPGEWELTCRERQLKAERAAKNEYKKDADLLLRALQKAEKERDEWLRLYTDSVIDRAELMEKAGLI